VQVFKRIKKERVLTSRYGLQSGSDLRFKALLIKEQYFGKRNRACEKRVTVLSQDKTILRYRIK